MGDGGDGGGHWKGKGKEKWTDGATMANKGGNCTAASPWLIKGLLGW